MGTDYFKDENYRSVISIKYSTQGKGQKKANWYKRKVIWYYFQHVQGYQN
jgi:hypothetical protein